MKQFPGEGLAPQHSAPIQCESVMVAEIPLDLAPFVQRMIAERRFLTESDVVAEGLRLLQAREILREEVRLGFDQLDAGFGIPADEVYTRAEQRIREIENENNVGR
jgi:Arc/MetJ-type ribon-helix-helix transcriptional regulator